MGRRGGGTAGEVSGGWAKTDSRKEWRVGSGLLLPPSSILQKRIYTILIVLEIRLAGFSLGRELGSALEVAVSE